MLWTHGLKLATAVAAVAMLGAVAQAEKFNKALNVGDKAPEFSSIEGTDGKKYSLDDFQDKNAIVVVFTCNHCPVAVACEDRIIALQKDYASKGVQVVAINVNNSPDDKLPKMRERAEEKGFNFPYCYDGSQESAKAYGARVTPHFFVLDGDRKLAYVGAMDDSPLAANDVKETYLRDALDAILAGKTPEVTKTKEKGCGIRYE